ncbi:hypothetical protein CBM2637_B40058 [Cupriavidus taiwanensis]|nr:hypothetical protein CBM2637_B40058 [Cupriavidus taiwanensis]
MVRPHRHRRSQNPNGYAKKVHQGRRLSEGTVF